MAKRSILMVYVLSIVTFGFYMLYWYYASKNDMNAMGAKIPSILLCLIPFVGIYWMYKYSEAFATVVKKDGNTVMYLLLNLFVGFVMPYIVQTELNNLAK